MKYNELKQLVEESRSTRRFKQDSNITQEDLKELVDVARITSSAKNAQPLKYILVTNKQLVEALSQATEWAAHLENWTQSKDEMPSAFILMLNDTNIDGFAMFDAGVSYEAISLAASVKNLDVCALASIDREICRDLLEIDYKYEVLLAIAIGEANETVKIVDVKDGDTEYFRDEQDQHCVPKRALDEVILGTNE